MGYIFTKKHLLSANTLVLKLNEIGVNSTRFVNLASKMKFGNTEMR